MKQKVIIKLFMDRNDQRCRTKAFKIAVSQPGVESAAVQGGENYQLEIVGEHVDPVVLTNCLRKKVGQAELVSVVSVVAAGSGANPEASKPVRPQPQPYSYPDFGVPQYQVYEVSDPNPACCSIM